MFERFFNLICKILPLKFRLKIKKLKLEKKISKNNNVFFGEESNIELLWGSNNNDVEMDEGSELFGILYSYNHGKIHIGPKSYIGKHTKINCVNSITLGYGVVIANDVIIVDHNFHSVNPYDRLKMLDTPHGSYERQPMFSQNAPIIIKDNVWIGNYARICKGVTIGENSVIGANSIVTKDIPANCVAVGNPARIVKTNIDKTTTPLFPL